MLYVQGLYQDRQSSIRGGALDRYPDDSHYLIPMVSLRDQRLRARCNWCLIIGQQWPCPGVSKLLVPGRTVYPLLGLLR